METEEMESRKYVKMLLDEERTKRLDKAQMRAAHLRWRGSKVVYDHTMQVVMSRKLELCEKLKHTMMEEFLNELKGNKTVLVRQENL